MNAKIDLARRLAIDRVGQTEVCDSASTARCAGVMAGTSGNPDYLDGDYSTSVQSAPAFAPVSVSISLLCDWGSLSVFSLTLDVAGEIVEYRLPPVALLFSRMSGLAVKDDPDADACGFGS